MRKTKEVRIDAEGRDKDKVFRLTEMSAWQTEKWALRAVLALAKAGVDLPEGLETAAPAVIAVMGVNAMAHVSFEDAEPLLDEMMPCIQIAPDKNNPQVTRPLYADDVEEVATLLNLRKVWMETHFDFSKAVGLLKSAQPGTTATQPDTKTSPQASAT